MIIRQIINIWLLRCPGYIKGFFIIIVSLREGLEYGNLVPFNDNIKFKQKAIGKVLVIKIYVLKSKVAEIAQFGPDLSVDLDVVVPEARNDVGYLASFTFSYQKFDSFCGFPLRKSLVRLSSDRMFSLRLRT